MTTSTKKIAFIKLFTESGLTKVCPGGYLKIFCFTIPVVKVQCCFTFIVSTFLAFTTEIFNCPRFTPAQSVGNTFIKTFLAPGLSPVAIGPFVEVVNTKGLFTVRALLHA